VARNDGKHKKMTRYDRGLKNNSTPNSCYNTLGPCFLATLGHVEFTLTHWGITRYIPPLSLDVPPKPPSLAVPLKLPSFPQRCLMFLPLLNVV